MTFNDDFVLADNDQFQIRVKMAVLKSAAAILGGALSGSGAVVDAKREKLAIAALTGGPVGDDNTTMTPSSVQERFIWAVAAQSPVNDDTNVENGVTALWNDIAGVDSTDPV